jgi:hypothetical protein
MILCLLGGVWIGLCEGVKRGVSIGRFGTAFRMGPLRKWDKNRHLQIIALARYYIDIEQAEEAEDSGDKAKSRCYGRSQKGGLRCGVGENEVPLLYRPPHLERPLFRVNLEKAAFPEFIYPPKK